MLALKDKFQVLAIFALDAFRKEEEEYFILRQRTLVVTTPTSGLALIFFKIFSFLSYKYLALGYGGMRDGRL